MDAKDIPECFGEAPQGKRPARGLTRIRRAAALAALLLVAGGGEARSHPLGNFSINHYTGIDVRGDSIVLHYVIDMAEIPTFLEMQENGITNEEGFFRSPYGRNLVRRLEKGLVLEVNGSRCPLSVEGDKISFPPGAGGLITMRIEADFRADPAPGGLHSDRNDVRYSDTNFEGRAGWKEIVVSASGAARLEGSSAGSVDRSERLTSYPLRGAGGPPQDLTARFTFALAPRLRGETPGRSRFPAGIAGPQRQDAVGSGALAGTVLPPSPARGASRWDLRFMQLISERRMSRSFFLFSMFLATLLGAFHALEPGHGKTLVAAYLVGARGTPWHALLLGLIVTFTHTAGVFLLGAATMSLSRYVFPEKLYPWMGFASGVLVAAVGLIMFRRRLRGVREGQHSHPHPGDRGAGDEHTRHAHTHPHPEDGQHVSLRQLLGLGISGGIVPCPAALVVLLGAISMGRVGYGMLLIVAFSLGLAMVLVAVGLLVVQAGRVMVRFREDSPMVLRWLPLLSSAFIVVLGALMATQGIVGTGILHP
jgi:nickel/cobalt exporter